MRGVCVTNDTHITHMHTHPDNVNHLRPERDVGRCRLGYEWCPLEKVCKT